MPNQGLFGYPPGGLLIGAMPRRVLFFSSGTTYVKRPGCRRVVLWGVGGGRGGWHGTSGAAGFSAMAVCNIEDQTTIPIAVGAGSSGNNNGSGTANGGTTSFGVNGRFFNVPGGGGSATDRRGDQLIATDLGPFSPDNNNNASLWGRGGGAGVAPNGCNPGVPGGNGINGFLWLWEYD